MKRILAGILFVTLMAPMMYLGTLPPKEAEAQYVPGLAGCFLGELVSTAITAGLKLVQTAVNFITGASALATVAAAKGALEDPTGAEATALAVADVSSVPVTTKNTLDSGAKANTSIGAAGGALASVGSLIMDTVNSIIGQEGVASTMSLLFKECVLDPLAWFLKNVVIEAITQDILAWINGGFSGAPAFMTDPVSFFQDLGAEAVDVFLFASGLDEFLCSPFQLTVIVDFYLDFNTPSFNEYGRMACTLDDIFANVAGASVDVQVQTGYEKVFNNGDISFEGGGFDAVFGALEDQNNPHGTKFNLQSAAAHRASVVKSKEHELIINGNGWFSLRCDLDKDGVMDTVCTPGAYVAATVDDWSGSALSQLEAADELAEIIDAVIAQLAKMLLEKVGSIGSGLLEAGDDAYWETSHTRRDSYQDISDGALTNPLPPPVTTTPPTVPPFLPGITITSPINGTTASGTIQVSATVSDPTGVVGITFKIDGVTIGDDVTAPYTVNLNTGDFAVGAHSISATARNAAGATSAAFVTLLISAATPIFP